MSPDPLLAAILAHPADDLARLVYADWIEEQGDPDRARFIRAQVELARVSPWEPFAVHARLQAPEWYHGEPWRQHLPDLGPSGTLAWHPDVAFRRGLGWGLSVRFVPALIEAGPMLCDQVPLGHLELGEGTLDDWRALARSPWLTRIESVRFRTTPIEPLTALIESPYSTGIRHLHFERANGAGMPELLRRLMLAPLGRQLHSLGLKNGPWDVQDMIESMSMLPAPSCLEHFEWIGGNLTPDWLRDLLKVPLLQNLTSLGLQYNRLENAGCQVLVDAVQTSRLRQLDLRDTWVDVPACNTLAQGDWSALRHLNLARNSLTTLGQGAVSWGGALQGLRSLVIRHSGTEDATLAGLVEAGIWPQLVELDVFRNHITDRGVQSLLDEPPRADLHALHLGQNRVSGEMLERLRYRHSAAIIT